MGLFKKYYLELIGIAAGTIAGFLYWKLIGCESGTCAITSKPLNSSLYGAVMGGLLFSLIRGKDKNTKK
ncbi:MAG TPA: DUF6132 family protein [Edaphocola sp.]|nr:DUF6132 family protein [Edaphocola sp.]